MPEILSVEMGDRFVNIGNKTTLEVIKIWFEFSEAEQRWETSVAWDEKHLFDGTMRLFGKGCDFVKILRDGGFVRVSRTEESLSNCATTTSLSPIPSVDLKRKQWEDDFRQNASRYGLDPTDLGRRICLFGNRSRTYTIIGAKPRNYKMPILVRGNRGGIYKITAEKAKAGLV